MLVLARRSLLALACASAAIAIPAPSTYPDGALTRDLVIRQNAIENCKDSYTTKNGLAFTNYCGQNNPQNDAVRNDQGIGIWFYTGTYTECLEHCSRFWGDGEGCFGITWTGAGGHCWLRTSNVTTATLEPQADAVSSVLTDRSQMKGYDTECPNADLSDKALTGVDGISYTTHCGKVIAEPPHCFNEFDCLDVPYRAFYHTESLEECLRVCAGLHPLCRAVSWNPGLQVGYANCWPKYGTQPAFVNPTSKQGIMHAAQMISFDIPDSSCPKDNVYQAGGKPDGPRFDVHCGKLNPGRNITNLHAHNITACMDACAASDKGCKAILFSSVLDGGYNNCYLQNTTSIITDQATASYAVIADAAIPSSDDPKNSPSASGSSSSSNNNNNNNSQSSSSSSSSSSPSKAWIAGPAIGGVIAISALGFAIFWFRRRRRASKNPAALEKDSLAASGYGSVPGHSPGGTASYDEADTAYYPNGTVGVNERAEMHASSTSELPANVKYAGNYGPRSEAQEMPT